MRKILVKKGYTIPDRYVELGDNEEICPRCKGLGVYRPDYVFTEPSVKCLDCLGSGKVLNTIRRGK